MQQIYTRPALVQDGRDVVALCDLSGLADLAASVPASNRNRSKCGGDWYGNKTYNKSIEQIRTGDLSGVAASDKILDQLELQVPVTQGWRVRHDVVGGVPNVAAYLAGQPYNMRRRERTVSEQAPLSVIASLELSGGINIETMRKRGATILALVRCLSNARPIELFVCVSIGNGYGEKQAAHIVCRIDTAPLDLARAAHVLTCPSVTRGIGYATGGMLLQDHLGASGWSGSWAYGDHAAYLKHAREIMRTIASPANEALYIAPAHLNDEMVNEPVKWISQKMAEYGGVELEAA